jgi:hypothetical protein
MRLSPPPKLFRVTFTLALAFALAPGARAQIEVENNFKFNSGQSIQPAFEG